MNRSLYVVGLAFSLLVGQPPTYGQTEPSPVARLIPDPGPVQVQRNGQTQPTSFNQTLDLFEGDLVIAGPRTRALVYFDDPPVRSVTEGERLVIKAPEDPTATTRSEGSSLWAGVWGLLGRLVNQEVQEPPRPNDGGVRAGESTRYVSPSLVLPDQSIAFANRPRITWWSAGESGVGYQVRLIEGADSNSCFGGTPVWRGQVTDTTWTYPADAPALFAGENYRIEVRAPNQEFDYACFRVASKTERARFRDAVAQMEKGTEFSSSAMKQFFQAVALADRGYFVDAFAVLQDLRVAHPEFQAAREMRTLLLYKIKQASP